MIERLIDNYCGQYIIWFNIWIIISLIFYFKDLTGGSAVFFLASYSYITDISSPEMRTIRIAFIDGLFPVGFYVGNALAGPVQKYLGPTYNFGLGMSFALLATLYAMFFLKDSRSQMITKLKEVGEKHSTPNSNLTEDMSGKKWENRELSKLSY